MKARVLAAIAAVVLALLGTVVLTAYVSGADQRALQGAAAVQVYVVKAPIPAGTAADKLADLVTQQTVPAKAEAAGAVTALDKLAGKVAGVDLVPGEQLISSRFVDPAALKAKTAVTGRVDVPAGMQEVSILLDPQRVAGGALAAGDTVGVFISLDGALNGTPGPVTHLTMQKVLVTAVQGAAVTPAPSTGGGDKSGSTPSTAPTGTVMVTLARDAPDAEKIVFAAEFGKIWLSKEPASADEGGTRKVTKDVVFQ
ncbi:MAG: RcpC/CpaB family pilus assembly protein [Actinomycetota bacterium]|nr:RcpC/CpaB family pilus assembly protein [Actinomycetota bacterium]